jgi:allantoinase
MAADLLIIRSTRILAEGRVAPGEVRVRAGKITEVLLDGKAAGLSPPAVAEVIDAGGLVVMPGLVDTHVHVNEPGRTEWEGFETAGRAAAAGGITTIVVMPLNCTPAATSVDALLGEARAAAGKCQVDYGLWGGLVPGNADQLEPMWNAGALGFKAFMVDSGVPDFAAVEYEDLNRGAGVLSRLNAPLLVHAEDAGCISRAAAKSSSASPMREYTAYATTRSVVCEMIAVRTLWILAGEHPSWPIHVVHVTCGVAAAFLDARVRGDRSLTGETCPHYLTFCAEEIPDGATEFKCAPPIRDKATREALWDLLRQGVLSMVVSDHSPCPPELKRRASGDFDAAWGGISSLQLGLSATWTGASARGFDLTSIARWMAENPAKLAGISRQKGRIAPGLDADLIFFDPDEEWTVDAAKLHHRHKLTPYHGRTLRGVVKRTILHGRTIYDASLSDPFPSEPAGRWIKRDQ